MTDKAQIHHRGPWQIAYKATNVLCADGIRRVVNITSEPDTMFTIPGSVQVRGKTVSGFISHSGEDHEDISFHAYKNGKNGFLLNKENDDATENPV